jgi:hypothetical protein
MTALLTLIVFFGGFVSASCYDSHEVVAEKALARMKARCACADLKKK